MRCLPGSSGSEQPDRLFVHVSVSPSSTPNQSVEQKWLEHKRQGEIVQGKISVILGLKGKFSSDLLLHDNSVVTSITSASVPFSWYLKDFEKGWETKHDGKAVPNWQMFGPKNEVRLARASNGLISHTILITRNTKWWARYIELPPQGQRGGQPASQGPMVRAVGQSTEKKSARVFLYVTHSKTTALRTPEIVFSTHRVSLWQQLAGLQLTQFSH